MKKNIEYSNKSWNPISGCLAQNSCEVKTRLGKCWAEKLAYRLKGRYGYDLNDPFKMTFHKDKLDLPLKWKNPRLVATCFMGDIAFANRDWINKVLEVIRKTPIHTYFILTKQPFNLLGYLFPRNVVLGVTININWDLNRILILNQALANKMFVSIEPLYENLRLTSNLLTMIDWIVIGAQSNPKYQPKRDWVENILKIADSCNIPVFMKDNLKFEPKRRELI